MKHLTTFENGIIGFFVGVLISTYLLFLSSTDAFIGNIISYVSLRPLFNLIHVSENYAFLAQFIFYIVIYIIYAIIIGLIIRLTNKTKTVVLSLALLIVAGAFEQIFISTKMPVVEINTNYQLARILKPATQESQQYFGMEANGDLNQDGKDDIAFLIHRNDTDRGILYYLTSAIQGENGKLGTNLIFLGDKIKPNKLTIQDGFIIVNITKNSSSTDLYAKIEDGQLVQHATSSTVQ